MAMYNYTDPSQYQPVGPAQIKQPHPNPGFSGGVGRDKALAETFGGVEGGALIGILGQTSGGKDKYWQFNQARGRAGLPPVTRDFFHQIGNIDLATPPNSESQPGHVPGRNIYADYLGFDPTERASLNPSVLEGFGNPYGMSANPYFGPGSRDPGDVSYFQPIIAARDNALRKVIAQATMAPERRSSAISDYASRVGGPLLSHDVDVAQGQELAQRNFSDSQRGLRLRNLLETMRGQGAEIYSTQRGLEASSKARAGNRALKKLSPLPEILGGIAGYFNAGSADQGIRDSYTRAHEK